MALVEVVGMIFDKLKAYGALIGCAILAVLLVLQTLALHKAERRADKAEVALSTERAAWESERAKAANALATATTEARKKEQALAQAAHQSEEIKNAEIANLATRAADLRRRLRNAEAGAATARLVSSTTSTSTAGEPAGERDRPELSGPAGFDLVTEAERADTIRFQLAACTRQYNAAREAMRVAAP